MLQVVLVFLTIDVCNAHPWFSQLLELYVPCYSSSRSLKGLLISALMFPIVLDTLLSLLRCVIILLNIKLCFSPLLYPVMMQDRETFFSEALQKWNQLNCTSDFVSFERDVRHKVDSLAQLVHHKVWFN